ncbi:Eco57I restriction-modification methylase domain-containing protein [uncultured Phascolarctobacterium sp.]|uniref:Eco57I restriction-modification methylase domain-containing protein n=1 Tax=uncultured Phascolarctobacterium sp. TaxID=512296 RepID=UPI0025E2A020|nr:Eco57I restriction-modification methylase domain-containing protein [uncultured Phascolarctobacterium sp.]
MADSLYETTYNPDVLSCLANLSNDEVFTPPNVANQMLDMLPQELFSDPNTKFLDPACKSGVFLREIAKRLIKGLETKIPDLQTRLDNIFHEQLYGIAITELTALLSRRSLYCSKYPNSKYSVSQFADAQGNIRFRRVEHTWRNGRCLFCGASKDQYGGRDGLETHAYEFIHTMNTEDIWNMKFDVIISNPPYQLNTHGGSAQAIPLYNKFVQKAIQLNPRFVCMIIPSRWFAGGMGLDDFRRAMLNDQRLKCIIDYTNAKDCFPGISIGGGVCYFLWDKTHHGLCQFTNIRNNEHNTLLRNLSEFSVFVRYNNAVSILHKIKSFKEKSMESIISSLSPFGIGSSIRGKEQPFENCLKLFSSRGIGYIDKKEISKGNHYIGKWKLAVSKVTGEHAGEPDKNGQFKILSKIKIMEPDEVCTFSYFVIGCEDSLERVKNIYQYLKTKLVRFLLLQSITSINISKDKFQFVPMQDFSKPWTDAELYAKYNLTQEEIDFIESMIKPMNTDGERDE